MSGELLTILRRPVEDAAPALLGWRLWSRVGDEESELVLTELEAYGGEGDPASHAYRGRTKRNSSMFMAAGTLYVYRSYGVHWCANAVTGPVGNGQAILLRAGLPTLGVDVIERRRSRRDHLADGPGKLTQALAITGALDGTSLVDGPVRLVPPIGDHRREVVATPRVGISRGTDRLWRFVLE